jgi:hypothetical protein
MVAEVLSSSTSSLWVYVRLVHVTKPREKPRLSAVVDEADLLPPSP